MKQRHESVEEFLRRGKTITKIPQVLDTVGSWWGFQERYQFESLREDTQQTVSWKSIQPNIRWDTDDDDRKYWNELNKRCDKILKKIRKQKKT